MTKLLHAKDTSPGKKMSEESIPPDILALLGSVSNVTLTNLANISLDDILIRDNAVAIFSRNRVWPFFFWITFVVGMIGNWLVVYILLRKHNLRTVTNLYLMNLAIGDIFYLVTSIPSISFWNNYWPLGEIMCKLLHYLMGVTMTVNVLSLTAVGLDRHYAILYPVLSKQHRTLKKTFFIITMFWCVSFILNIPSLVIAKQLDFVGEEVCISYWRKPWEHKTYSLCMYLLLYIIPQCILAVCYFRIGNKLWFSCSMHNSNTSSKALKTLQSRRRVVKVVIVVTCCFAVCWLPVHLVELYSAYGKHFSKLFHEIKLLAPLVPHLFIATNPIMYCFMSKTFRVSFKAAFTCNKRVLISRNWRVSSQNRTVENKDFLSKSASMISDNVVNQKMNGQIESLDKALHTSPTLPKHVAARQEI